METYQRWIAITRCKANKFMLTSQDQSNLSMRVLNFQILIWNRSISPLLQRKHWLMHRFSKVCSKRSHQPARKILRLGSMTISTILLSNAMWISATQTIVKWQEYWPSCFRTNFHHLLLKAQSRWIQTTTTSLLSVIIHFIVVIMWFYI